MVNIPGVSGIISRMRGVMALLRLRPFDTQTESGRSLERHRRALLTAIASAGTRGIALLTSLITVPLTIGYLGDERYGLWMTITALVSMLAFLDLGIGAGLIGAVAEADGKGDRTAARRYVSAAVFSLSGIAASLLLMLAVSFPLLPWGRVLNVDSPEAIMDGSHAAVVLVACFAVAMPLTVVQRVQAGFQEGFESNIWSAAGSVLSLAGVLIVIYTRGGLPWLVAATAGVPLLVLLLNAIVVFGFRRPWLWPRWEGVDRDAMRRVVRQGFLFFVLQVAMVVGYQSDHVVINQVLGPEQVTQFAVPFRLFSILPMLLQMGLGPLWPAYGEAAARGDAAWVRRTLVRSIKLACWITIPPALLLVIFGRPIVHAWVGDAVTPGNTLLIALGLWAIVIGICTAQAMFMNGLHVVKLQVVCCTIMAVVNIALSIVLTRRVGVAGVALGTVIAQTLCVMVPFWIYTPKILARVGRSPAKDEPSSPAESGTVPVVNEVATAAAAPPSVPA